MLRNPKLQLLANILPDVIAASRQPNTVKVYVTWYNCFLKWAKTFEELDTMPVSELTIAMFLLSLYQQGSSTSSLQQCISAINWIHDLSGCTKPTDSPMVKLIVEGSIRLNSKSTQRKKPITVDMIRELKHHMIQSCNPINLMDNRLLTYMLLSFSGFLRYDEACHIRRSDIQFHTSHISLFIERSQTDVYRTGKTVIIARTNTDLCPVKALLDYLRQAGIPRDSDHYIFHNVAFQRSKNKYILRPTNTPMSYSRTRELLLSKLQGIGLDKSDFGTHSLRAGGATAAAANHTEERLMMMHGR